MRMAVVCPFIEKENFVHKGIMYDGNVITGIGMFFREFAEAVLQRFGYDLTRSCNIFAQKVDTTQNSQNLYCFFLLHGYIGIFRTIFSTYPSDYKVGLPGLSEKSNPDIVARYFFNKS